MGGSISFLAERDCLTFVANTTEGGLDDNNNWVEGKDSPPIHTRGNLQPYIPRGTEQVSAPHGFTLESSKMYKTKVCLPTMDDLGHKKAARTIIGGRTYFVLRKYDYSTGMMATSGYFYVLVLQHSKEGSV